MSDQSLTDRLTATYMPGVVTAKPEHPRLILLSHLSPRIAKETGKQAPKHRSLYGQVLDGVIPAEFINRQWWIREDNVPLIIERLGLADSDPTLA